MEELTPRRADRLDLDLARTLPTPLYVHDLAVVRARVAALRAVLPAGSGLLYSLKANPLGPVVAALTAAGCGSEVSSTGELATALGAGAEPGPLLFTGPGKSDAEIGAALAAGALLSCESAGEVERLGELAPDGVDVLLRVQPPARPAAGLSMADGRQFGFLPEEAVEVCRRPPAGLRVVGFHCYLGSQLPHSGALLAAFGHVTDVIGQVAVDSGVTPEVVDLGGGFPWPFAEPGDGADLRPLAADLEALIAPLRAAGTRVWFESGRSLVAPAGRLLTRVLDVKERGDHVVVVTDAGVNVLGGMSGLGRVLRPATGFRNLSKPHAPPCTADVVGPLCTPLDRLAVRTFVPDPHVGDVLCVENVGAYAATAALGAFLSRPAPVEVVVDGAELVGAWSLRTGYEQVPVP